MGEPLTRTFSLAFDDETFNALDICDKLLCALSQDGDRRAVLSFLNARWWRDEDATPTP